MLTRENFKLTVAQWYSTSVNAEGTKMHECSIISMKCTMRPTSGSDVQLDHKSDVVAKSDTAI